MADGGTLFLDEIANIPVSQQATLLRALETGELQRVGSSQTRRVDARVISATNADLYTEVAAGRFREDLLFRLNTVHLHLPPLRERRADIPALAMLFLGRHAQRYGKQIAGFDDAAMRALQEHTWPGNVRELGHVVERAVLLTGDAHIQVDDLVLERPAAARKDELDGLSLEEAERFLVEEALRRFQGNISRAAQSLGLSRAALYRRLHKHGL
jgi:DNA-binding NtrC family response regulator